MYILDKQKLNFDSRSKPCKKAQHLTVSQANQRIQLSFTAEAGKTSFSASFA